MKKSILFALFMLNACSSGNSDPRIGKAELTKLKRWEAQTNIDANIEIELNRRNPQTDESFMQIVNETVKRSVEKEKQQIRALKLEHREVRKIAQLYEEMLTITPELYQATLTSDKKRIVMLQAKIEQLNQQSVKLEKQIFQ